MSTPLRLPPLDDYGDEISDDDIVYEPLDDVTWVDIEDEPAIELTAEEEAALQAEAAARDADSPADARPAALDAEPDAPAASPEPASESEPAPPAGPPCLFRVVIPLPDDLRDAITEARGAHDLNGDAPATLEWIAPFRCEQIDALEEALRAWAAERLPLHVTLSEVTAEVMEARRYLAGWALTPAGRVAAARQALTRALAGLVEPCADAPDPFEPRVVVADRVPAPVFPHLIASMQKTFEPQGRTIDTVALEESPPDERAPRWSPRLTLP